LINVRAISSATNYSMERRAASRLDPKESDANAALYVRDPR
jgi:hypothetical protein